MKALLTALAVIPLLFGCTQKREITGELFVSGKDGTSYKLGAVLIPVYPAVVVNEHFSKYMRTANDLSERATAELRPRHDELLAVETKLLSGPISARDLRQDQELVKRMNELGGEVIPKIRDRYESLLVEAREELFSLGDPVLSTSTDADGNFHFTLRSAGDYIIVVRVKRLVGQETENYYWFVSIKNERRQRLLLNNLNMTRLTLLTN
jgi:hypothetical protein